MQTRLDLPDPSWTMGLDLRYGQVSWEYHSAPPGFEPACRLPRRFVVKEHHATELHFDFRLEMGGTLKSWATGKGPSLDPRRPSYLTQVSDHSFRGLIFAGTIPPGMYGAGDIELWDFGEYRLESPDPVTAWMRGDLHFTLHGRRLGGGWRLHRVQEGREELWKLQKLEDEFALVGHQAELISGPYRKAAPTPRPRRGRRQKFWTIQTEMLPYEW